MKMAIPRFLLIIMVFYFSNQLFAISETQIKAVLLEKYTHLIQWPQKVEVISITQEVIR